MTMTEYKLLDSNDGIIYEAETVYPNATTDTQDYPGNRRQVLRGEPPQGTVLVKTAGNALMAVDRSMLQQKGVVSVVIPYGKGPGDVIFVKCPYSTEERLLSTRIPDGVGPGQIMFLQAPPVEMMTANEGETVDENNGKYVVEEEEESFTELKLAAEHELEQRHFGEEHGNSNKGGNKDKADDEFEMV